jgi:hypothetical protein
MPNELWYRLGWPRIRAEVGWWIRGLPQGHLLHRWYARKWRES